MARPAQAIGTVAALDVGTTGFSPCTGEIIELTITKFRCDRYADHVMDVVGEYSGMREPSCPIPRCASTVHEITRRQVRALQLDYRRIRPIVRQTDFVVAH
ncbi:MAG: hypothetical protein NTY38_32365 [Acidobacteria bacterium]|nr:hypothetical protein [Acidobacteriota bacterium]